MLSKTAKRPHIGLDGEQLRFGGGTPRLRKAQARVNRTADAMDRAGTELTWNITLFPLGLIGSPSLA